MQENIVIGTKFNFRKTVIVVVHFVSYYKKGRKIDLWSGIEKPQRGKADFAMMESFVLLLLARGSY